MFLCNLFSDEFEAEERQTTLGAEGKVFLIKYIIYLIDVYKNYI